MNLPNAITIARLLSVPFIGWLILRERYSWALVAFGVAAASDAVDGLLARLLDQRTPLGATLDPAADKLLVVTGLAALWWVGHIPGWLFGIVLGRDLTLSAAYWGMFAAGRRLPVQPSLFGKATTVLQLLLVLWIIWDASRSAPPGLPHVPLWLLVAVAGITLASGLLYVRSGYRMLQEGKAA
jgi:cardiolipin synthase